MRKPTRTNEKKTENSLQQYNFGTRRSRVSANQNHISFTLPTMYRLSSCSFCFTFFLLLIFYFSSNNNTIGTFSFLIIFIHCLAAPLWLWCISVISFSLFFALYSKYMCDWINRLAVFRVSQKTWIFIAVFIFVSQNIFTLKNLLLL